METIKQPAMIVSTINAVALIGSFAYFYKRTGTLETELQAMNKNVKIYVKTVVEMKKTDKTSQFEQDLVSLKQTNTEQGETIKKMEKTVVSLTDEVRSLRYALDVIIKSLESKGEKIDINPPRRPKKPRTPAKPPKVEFFPTESSTDESSSSSSDKDDKRRRKAKKDKKGKKPKDTSDEEGSDDDIARLASQVSAGRRKN